LSQLMICLMLFIPTPCVCFDVLFGLLYSKEATKSQIIENPG